MRNDALTERVTGLLETEAIAHGFDLVLAEFGGQKHRPLIRVFLDREGGLDIEAITGANAWIKDVLDAQPEFNGDYVLEVSTPGIERPLVKLADFERFAGCDAKVTTTALVNGRKHFTGRLVGVEGTDIAIDVDGTQHRIPHSVVRTAHLRVEIDFNREG